MGALTRREQQQVDQANASGKPPVVLIHGLWLLPSSWDRWAGLFEEAAFEHYLPNKWAFDRAWGEFIPAALKDRADRFLREG